MEIRAAPEVAAPVALAKIRLKRKQVMRARSFEEHHRARYAHVSAQIRDHMHVVAHNGNFQQCDSMPLRGSFEACFASLIKLLAPQSFEAELGAPLQVVHILPLAVLVWTGHMDYLGGEATAP